MALTAGWHCTIFPPYFVAGAIFSGCAMVITLLLPLSIFFKLEDYIDVWHFEHLAKMCLLTGGILTYAYAHRALHRLVLGQPLRVGHLRLPDDRARTTAGSST